MGKHAPWLALYANEFSITGVTQTEGESHAQQLSTIRDHKGALLALQAELKVKLETRRKVEAELQEATMQEQLMQQKTFVEFQSEKQLNKGSGVPQELTELNTRDSEPGRATRTDSVIDDGS
jgi:hypothetical protein